jgi:hypothetical protein
MFHLLKVVVAALTALLILGLYTLTGLLGEHMVAAEVLLLIEQVDMDAEEQVVEVQCGVFGEALK